MDALQINQIERREKERERCEKRKLLLSFLGVGPILGVPFADVRHHSSTSPPLFDWVVKVI